MTDREYLARHARHDGWGLLAGLYLLMTAMAGAVLLAASHAPAATFDTAARALTVPILADTEWGYLPRPPAEDLGVPLPPHTKHGADEWEFHAAGWVPAVDENGEVIGWWWVEAGDRIYRQPEWMVHKRTA